MNISKCEGNDTCSKYKCRKSPKAPESNVVHLSIVTFKAVYGIKLKKEKKKKTWQSAEKASDNIFEVK